MNAPGSAPAATEAWRACVADAPDDVFDSEGERELVTSWREVLDRYSRISCALERELQERHGIGQSEFEALEVLVLGSKEKYRAQELTDVLPLSQSAASRVIARLERDGFAERLMCDLDRRGIFVAATEAGRVRYAEARPTHRAVLADNL